MSAAASSGRVLAVHGRAPAGARGGGRGAAGDAGGIRPFGAAAAAAAGGGSTAAESGSGRCGGGGGASAVSANMHDVLGGSL
ncbi:hypothetical protein EKD16_01470 [Streptomonospora litoralis]|uniref:Uncharacterized protein n=1 Tax=Streptomonospora litoralis TaxID=2498135 RepID=A0A4P6PYZ5_9ACTN|nr:hypothetical protein EKD16_01470 [Streptomonospora litoralis]